MQIGLDPYGKIRLDIGTPQGFCRGVWSEREFSPRNF